MQYPLTYLQFHAVFILPVLVGLLVAARYRLASRRAVISGTLLLALLAAVYTTPWDRYLILRGAWWYGEGRVFTRFAAIPLGEYLFFVLQPLIVGLWVGRFSVDTSRPLAIPIRTRLVGAVVAALVGLSGLALLTRPGGLYLGLLLAWSAPVLAIQWAFGWPFLVAHWRTVAVGTLVPVGYLWVADTVAIWLGIWVLSKQHTLGLEIPLLGLPIEEAVFFLLTSLFVVQGLVLYVWVLDRWQ
ncbi:lycopene cyclase domain-containing protein [Halomicroarcula sp. GCM10025324]|uniref:lycopene cyclase domain-containing protein n=1 Tax=Haloarcula TaxID=2237 RepID=UPI0023E89A69|nr:lycopene cyclase domain-containing protein [Halomicroarcula sp. ZS-22-S1]